MSEIVKITKVEGRAVTIRGNDIDTDRIIPARFLVAVSFEGLERHVFEDDRTGGGHPFDNPAYQGASILIVNRNFGCGSSREHAVWALQGAGFSAVVSSQFADIFRGNALGNGLLPIEVSKRMLARLMDIASSQYMASLAIDLETQTLQLPDGDVVKFPITPFAKHCVLEGIGEMDFLLGATESITAFEAAHR